jgi:transposase
MAGTIFQDTRTPLRSWFHAVFLMASTRCGISAKQLQREIGVTYKTAWRMFRQIRSLLNEPPSKLSGEVEIDETYIGGRYKGIGNKKVAAQARLRNKHTVAGHIQRGGRLNAFYLPEGTAGALVPLVREYVTPGSMVYSDELPAYKALSKQGYQHRRVHHRAKVWVSGTAHINTLESFWGLLKRGISGVYHSVGSAYLQSYVNEYVFRYNHRSDEVPMFQTMLCRVEKSSPVS